jgi:hypothetical protein
MVSPSIIDENWQILLSLFPKDWKSKTTMSGAIERLRGFESAEALMRTLLLHIARGYSMRETVVRAKTSGIAEISDVALLKRLRNSEAWLRSLCLCLLRENGVTLPERKQGMNLRVVDATIVKELGKTGSQWRIHYSIQIPSLACDFFEVTPTKGVGSGETFKRLPVAPHDLIMGDRGYSSAFGIEYLAQAGAYVLVRINTGASPLFSERERKFPLLKTLNALPEAGIVREWKVMVRGEKDYIEGRLCVVRKSEHEIAMAHRKLNRRSSKNGISIKKQSFEFAKYVIVFTTLPEDGFTTSEVLEWYRIRWQIELVFKRLKTLAKLGHLPKHDPESSRAWLYGKLFVALLTQKLLRLGRDFSPWGYEFEKQSPAERLA